MNPITNRIIGTNYCLGFSSCSFIYPDIDTKLISL